MTIVKGKDGKRAYSQKAMENGAWKKREEVIEVKGKGRSLSDFSGLALVASLLMKPLISDKLVDIKCPYG